MSDFDTVDTAIRNLQSRVADAERVAEWLRNEIGYGDGDYVVAREAVAVARLINGGGA